MLGFILIDDKPSDCHAVTMHEDGLQSIYDWSLAHNRQAHTWEMLIRTTLI